MLLAREWDDRRTHIKLYFNVYGGANLISDEISSSIEYFDITHIIRHVFMCFQVDGSESYFNSLV